MNINELYEKVTDEVAAEKTAADVNADQGVEFDATFFEKIADNDDESVAILNKFVNESREEGYTDDQIENGIVLAMQEAGVETGDVASGGTVTEGGDTAAANTDAEDEFEIAKAAEFLAGSEKGLEDALSSDLAKEAGITMDDLEKVELGHSYGEGYAKTREAIDPIVEKIAAARQGDAKEAAESQVRKNILSKIAATGHKGEKYEGGKGDMDDKKEKGGKDYMMAMLKKHRGKK